MSMGTFYHLSQKNVKRRFVDCNLALTTILSHINVILSCRETGVS